MARVEPTFLDETGVWMLESTGWASAEPTDGGASKLSSHTPKPIPMPRPSDSSFGKYGDASYYTIYPSLRCRYRLLDSISAFVDQPRNCKVISASRAIIESAPEPWRFGQTKLSFLTIHIVSVLFLLDLEILWIAKIYSSTYLALT